jgi:hypothetical protein
MTFDDLWDIPFNYNSKLLKFKGISKSDLLVFKTKTLCVFAHATSKKVKEKIFGPLVRIVADLKITIKTFTGKVVLPARTEK